MKVKMNKLRNEQLITLTAMILLVRYFYIEVIRYLLERSLRVCRETLGSASVAIAILLMSLGMGLSSCEQQPQLVQESISQNPLTAVIAFANVPHSFPDSIPYHSKFDSGLALGQKMGADSSWYAVRIPLTRPLNGDTLAVQFWRLGLRLVTRQFTENGDDPNLEQVYSVRSNSDNLDTMILHVYDSVCALNPTAHPSGKSPRDSIVLDAQYVYANLLLSGQGAFRSFSEVKPYGWNSDSIQAMVLKLAAKSGMSLAAIVKTWAIPLDYNSAKVKILDMGLDAGNLFSPFQIRVKSPLSMDSIFQGGPMVPVHGSFISDSGLTQYSVRIFRGDVDKSDQFLVFAKPVRMDGSTKVWDLSADAALSVQSKSAEFGDYKLEVVVFDVAKISDTARFNFHLFPPADHSGPVINLDKNIGANFLENSDSTIDVEVGANDPSGVDSVLIDGVLAGRKGSIWSRAVIIPIVDQGYVLHVIALDSIGNRTDSSRLIFRKGLIKNGAALIHRIQPKMATGDSLPFDTPTLHAVWSITDPSGIDTASVVVKNAVNVRHQDSIWSADIFVPPTGVEFPVSISVKNKAGNSSVDYIFVTRKRDTIPPEIFPLLNTVSKTLRWSDSIVNCAWSVTDNGPSVTVRIQGDSVACAQSVCSKTLNIPIGKNVVRIKVEDQSKNPTIDSVVLIRQPPKAVAISVGSAHTLALLEDGTFAQWGDTAFGLQRDQGVVHPLAFAAGASYSLALSQSGQLLIWGSDSNGIKQPQGFPSPIKSIPSGSLHELVLMENGKVAAWGRNFNKQCDVPDDLKPVVQVSAGSYFSVALQNDSTVRVWGDSSYGQWRIPDTSNKIIAVAAGAAHVLALLSNGMVIGWGGTGSGEEKVPDRLRTVKAIAARGRASLALRENGTVSAWGDNFYGQLNVPDDLVNVVAIGVGSKFALALKSDGNIVCWGDNSKHQCDVPVGLRP